MKRTKHIVAVQHDFTLDGSTIDQDQWLRMRSEASQSMNKLQSYRLRTSRTFTILATVEASSKVKLQPAVEAFLETDEWLDIVDQHGIGATWFPGIQYWTPEELEAAQQEERTRHAHYDALAEKERARQAQWTSNTVKIGP
jgi:hypothetical protein